MKKINKVLLGGVFVSVHAPRVTFEQQCMYDFESIKSHPEKCNFSTDFYYSVLRRCINLEKYRYGYAAYVPLWCMLTYKKNVVVCFDSLEQMCGTQFFEETRREIYQNLALIDKYSSDPILSASVWLNCNVGNFVYSELSGLVYSLRVHKNVMRYKDGLVAFFIDEGSLYSDETLDRAFIRQPEQPRVQALIGMLNGAGELHRRLAVFFKPCMCYYFFRLIDFIGYEKSDVAETNWAFLRAILVVMDYVLMRIFTELLSFEEITSGIKTERESYRKQMLTCMQSVMDSAVDKCEFNDMQSIYKNITNALTKAERYFSPADVARFAGMINTTLFVAETKSEAALLLKKPIEGVLSCKKVAFWKKVCFFNDMTLLLDMLRAPEKIDRVNWGILNDCSERVERVF